MTKGAMLVGIVAGSDKTVASVATGHQEYHPMYIGPGNIDNPTRRAHSIGLLPCAFLPIPKGALLQFHFMRLDLIIMTASQKERKTVAYQQFCHQLYHACLAYVYDPLKPSMTSPEVVQCPDGHFHHAIFSIGPFIADYPEQVWLTCIVQN
jgi:Plavaka transposase